MTPHRIGLFSTLLASAFLVNCGSGDAPASTSSDGGASGAGGSGDTPTAGAPVASGAPLCVISADCPSGAHCDLGQCVQDCNDENACSKGTACSARARCLPENESDADPVPNTTYLGTVSAAPLATLLTEGDQTMKVTLTSTSKKPVRYRMRRT
jgi:hypothetical protein